MGEGDYLKVSIYLFIYPVLFVVLFHTLSFSLEVRKLDGRGRVISNLV